LSEDNRKKLSDRELLLSPVISPAAFWSGLPYVVTIHDFQEKYYPSYFSARERIRRSLINRALARSASLIICESSYVKSDIIKFTGANAAKVAVLQAPPRVMAVDSSSKTKSPKSRLPGEYVFYPAQFWPHKNHVALVEAFAILARQLPSLSLVLTGDLKRYETQVFPRVNELGLNQRIICLGYVSDLELSEAYARARAIVIPTLFESISIPVFEAFQHGVPVCCSNILGLPEQVGDAGLLFDPHDPKAIAETVARLLSDSTLRAQLVEKGTQRLKNFEIIDYGRRLLSAVSF
jgi:glycosyltransferase involved in cell wall biosynthesis